MTSSPRIVSVIVATRNRPELLCAALASIRALEGEDLKFEILVGDNGTMNEAEAVAAEFGALYARTERDGCAAARNVALSRVTGEFIALLDDDDLWLPGHIRPHIALLDARPELEAVFGQIISTDVERNPIGKAWPSELPADGELFLPMLSGYFPQVGATLTRARALKTHGLMDERLIGDSDWDWQMRIARAHKIGFTPTPCVLFRQRPPGSFHELQLRRANFTRRIFMRHASEALRRSRSLVALMRAYRGALSQYYDYFIDAAVGASARGENRAAVQPVTFAFAVFPLRTLKLILTQPGVRKSFWAGLRGQSLPSRAG